MRRFSLYVFRAVSHLKFTTCPFTIYRSAFTLLPPTRDVARRAPGSNRVSPCRAKPSGLRRLPQYLGRRRNATPQLCSAVDRVPTAPRVLHRARPGSGLLVRDERRLVERLDADSATP